MTRLVLASASPRRRELLSMLTDRFEIRPADIDEEPVPGETPVGYVARLAIDKAGAVHRPGELVLGADTTVEIDGRILAKPESDDEAREMLRALSGRTHAVHTGVALVSDTGSIEHVQTTSVRFDTLGADEIEWYVSTGEPADKAGGYALQGHGGRFVTNVTGSVTNVIGLPLHVVMSWLIREKVEVLGTRARR